MGNLIWQVYSVAGWSSRWMKKEAFRVKLVKIAGWGYTEGWLHSTFVFTADVALSTSQALRTIKKCLQEPCTRAKTC